MPEGSTGNIGTDEELETAFIVGLTTSGKTTIFLDHEDELITTRKATLNDVDNAAVEIVRDLNAQRAARYVMLGLKEIAEQRQDRPSAKVEEALKKRRRR
jgi:hypothetical protein